MSTFPTFKEIECVMIFYLYFCTKYMEGRRMGSLLHCRLGLQCLEPRRGLFGTIWPHTMFTVFTHMPLKGTVTPFHQPSKQSAPYSTVHATPHHTHPYESQCVDTAHSSVCFYCDKFNLNHWIEFHTHSTCLDLERGGIYEVHHLLLRKLHKHSI